MFNVITGLSQDYYNTIGQKMIESWLDYWPQDMQLTVYTEDQLKLDHPRIKTVNLDTMDSDYHQFQQHKMKLATRAKKFAKKAWPIMKNLESDTGYLIWVDADVITIGNIQHDWLLDLIGKNQFSAHIGVMQGEYYSVETGFFIINRSNSYKQAFLDEYQRIYQERDFTNQHKPFDGDVFGRVIRTLRSDPEFKYRELNPEYATARSPFNGIFNGYMTHYKAKRKNVFSEDQWL